jgi:hypothetical protein
MEYVGTIKRVYIANGKAWIEAQTDDDENEVRIALPVGYATTLKVGASFRMETSGAPCQT